MILSNPDMLHIGVLPHHDRWADVLANLRYVVVDEAHVYRGVFGSHVANVLRRLQRLARIYGADPQFLLASATISNPGELAANLLGRPVTVIGDDAAPRAERTVVLWNPPLLDEELGLRGSALAEAAKLQAGFVEQGLRTLTFAKSRKAAELIHRFTAERLGDDSRLSPYRAGYTAQQRREIERRLGAGELLGVSATNALELGIDVGLLDAVISVGFPGTVASAPPAVGPGGAARARARRARRDRGRTRPVLHARAGQAARAPRRSRDPRSREPQGPRGPCSGGCVRGAGERGRRGDPRQRRPRRRGCRPRAETHAGGLRVGGQGLPGRACAAALGRCRRLHDRRRRLRRRARTAERSRAYTTVHPGAIYLHLGESYSSASSTSDRFTPLSSRSRPTGTRRRRKRRRRRSSVRCARNGGLGCRSSSARSR